MTVAARRAQTIAAAKGLSCFMRVDLRVGAEVGIGWSRQGDGVMGLGERRQGGKLCFEGRALRSCPAVVDVTCGEDFGGVGGSNAIVWGSSVGLFFVHG